MKNYSLCVSLLSVLAFVTVQSASAQASVSQASMEYGCKAGEETADSVHHREYTVQMNVRGREVTGICVVELRPGGEVVGTMMSDFGTKIFDFVHRDGKTKVLNLMKPIDRWYIRRVLRRDFGFIITKLLCRRVDTPVKGRTASVMPDGSVTVTNRRFKIQYLFAESNSHDTD